MDAVTTEATVRPLSPNIGVEIIGLEVRGLDAHGFEVLKTALLDYCMVVIRDQPLSPEEQVAFSKLWGDIFFTPHLIPIPGHPEVVPVNNRGKAATVTEAWHSDSPFAAPPPSLTILSAQHLPEIGGDTMFANQYLAYDRLSPGVKLMIRDMRVTYVSSVLAKFAGKGDTKLGSATHAVENVHPETGRTSLYVMRGGRINGMAEEESRVVLDLLQSHCAQPDMVYRHRWRPGDLVMWDNRCTQHYAIHDHGDAARLLHRTTVVRHV
jgi:taurine dioxygenase